MRKPAWDYLIITASNPGQARAYEWQLARRRNANRFSEAGEVMVVPDPGGKRIGSGGSTLACLLEVLNREAQKSGAKFSSLQAVQTALSRLRILIIHAGGDSKRLPAYGPCGKIFVPVPAPPNSTASFALFDRQWPALASLPAPSPFAGQVVITAGDALIWFNPAEARFSPTGITALAAAATVEEASRHGVFCARHDGRVRLYLQKPAPQMQQKLGAILPDGRALLDVGIMSFDAAAATNLLRAFGLITSADRLQLDDAMEHNIHELGVDFFREICCALGTESTPAHYLEQVHSAGSRWPQDILKNLFKPLHEIPMHISLLSQCHFLHFGTTRQLITAGNKLALLDSGKPLPDGLILLGNALGPAGCVQGKNSWIEGCRIEAKITLAGNNVLVGVDILDELTLPEGACLDVLGGWAGYGQPVSFIRPHGVSDTFKDAATSGATFCGLPLLKWLELAAIKPEQVWDQMPPQNRTLWEARLFPAETDPQQYRRWLWMFNPSEATPEQKKAFLEARRYSSAEISLLANLEAFYARRQSAAEAGAIGCG